MSLADLPDAFFRTILQQLATLFLQGAGGDIDAAHQAAVATLRAYDPRTEAEFRLAARIIACSLQAGEALAQAANPDHPLTRVLRLRSGAVALSREAEKAERRLDKLRAARLTAPEPLPEVELVWEPLEDKPQATIQETPAPATDAVPMPVAEAVADDTSNDVWTADPWAKRDAGKASATPSTDDHKVAAYAAANGLTWTEALKQRRREQALAERQRKRAMHTQAA